MKSKRKMYLCIMMIAMLLLETVWTGYSRMVNMAHAEGNIWYVKPDGAGSGTSWDNAFGELQLALDAAQPGDQIWLAKGTYYPTGNIIGSDPRTVHFEMKNDVAIYGGFAGDESLLEHRDFSTNETILSGDLDQDGSWSDVDAYHVFFHKNLNLNETAILDGVTISGGRANGSSEHSHGGGMYNEGSSPALTNVVISGNTALNRGGGMANVNSNPTLTGVTISSNVTNYGGGMANQGSSPELMNVTISGNTAKYNGGGMYNDGGSPALTHVEINGNTAAERGGGIDNVNSNPTLTDVTISSNEANHGGGVFNEGSSPALTGVTISGNSVVYDGGGMYNNTGSSPKLTNVAITGNTATRDGGGMYNINISSPTLTNVTISGNSATATNGAAGGGIRSHDSSRPIIRNSIIWGNGNHEIVGVAEYFNSISGRPDDPDPKFIDPEPSYRAPTTEGDYRLQSNSPAINAGDDGVFDTGKTPDLSNISTDLDGNERFRGEHVDLGAYEYQRVLPASTLTAEAGDQKVILRWNAVAGAYSYIVYQYEGESAPADPANWEEAASGVSGTNITITGLTNGMRYRFAVQAVNSSGESSDYSNAVTVTPPHGRRTAIAAGISHSLALKENGSVVAWGLNTQGQTTVPAEAKSEVVAIAAGYYHSLALKENGSVVAWGNNGSGQMVVPVEARSDVVAIEAGRRHSLALKEDGTVVAWGDSFADQTKVPDGLTGVVAISAGFDYSLALKEDGTVVGWGWNGHGQTDVPEGLSNVVAISAGYTQAMALRADGTVAAWGWGNNNGLDGVPEGLIDVVAISAGQLHNLALKEDGSVVAWGSNNWLQSTVPDIAKTGVVAIAAGGYHSLALKADGTVVAWGRNEDGQILPYKVTFDNNGGDVDAGPSFMSTVYGGNVGTLPTPPTREGYSFAGWNTSADGSGDAFDAATLVTSDLTVYAQWTAITYTVTFDRNGGDTDANPAVMPVAHGGTVGTLPTPPTRSDNAFVGWNTVADGSGDAFGAATVVTSDLTVYAQWTEITYTVTFDRNGGNTDADPMTMTVAHGGTVGALPTPPTRSDNAFVGWNTSADGSGDAFGAATVVTSDLTVYAQWTEITYTVTFARNGGNTDADPMTMTVAHGGTVGALPTPPTRSDNAFVGWNTSADGSGDAFGAATVVTSDLAVYAQWTAITYTVTFDRNGGDTDANPAVMTVAHGGHVGTLPTPPTRSDNAFAGWNTSADGSGDAFGAATVVTSDLTVYAQWTEITYTVTFDRNGGNTDADPMTMTVAHGGTVGALPTPPTRSDNAFAGWNTSADGSGDAFGAATVVTSDLTVYAQWTGITYTVTFDRNGGNTDANPTVMTTVYGGNFGTLPFPPTREGYSFAGWNSVADGSGDAFDAATLVTSDLTVYAQWTGITYTVTFDRNGGNTDANPTVMTTVCGGNFGTLPFPPTREGYSFAGWNTAADGSGDAFDAATLVTSDLTVYAQWTGITYTVTFDRNGGNTDADPAVMPVAHGGHVGTLPTPPTRTRYTFTGWNTAADGTGDSFNVDTAVTSDLTVYAQWTLNSGGGWFFPSPSCNTKVISSNGQLTLPACRAGEISLGEDITIIISEDATDQALSLIIEKVLNPEQLLAKKDRLASQVYEVSKNVPANFKKPITLILTFDSSGIKSNQIPVVFYYVEAKKEWVGISGGKVEGNRIAVEVEQLAKFAVFAVDKAGEAPGQDSTNAEINFSDFAGHWAESSIKQAVSGGIVSGYPDGTFRPGHLVTRAEFTVMLASALKLDGTGATLHFNDQDKIGAWAKRAAALAVEAGIVNGYEDGSFRPDANITRAEMASMIAKALKLSLNANAQTGFADNEAIPNWAKGAVEAVRELGIVIGRGDNHFVPNDTATRAEAVVMLLRMLERIDTN